jgi:hypothetical protein
MSTYKLVCPACYGPMVIRTSEGQTPCFRALYYQCKNFVCGATYGGSQTIDYMLSPSGVAKPLNVVPLAPSRARKQALIDTRATDGQLDLLDPLDDMEHQP